MAEADDLQAAYNAGFQDAMGEASLYFIRYTSWAHLSPSDLESLYNQFKEDVESMYPGPYEKPKPPKKFMVSGYEGDRLVSRRWPLEGLLQGTVQMYERLGYRVEIEEVKK